jgi:exoribonuclease R
MEFSWYITVSFHVSIIDVFSCSIATNCNRQKYQAKRVGEQSSELYLTVYIGLHGPMIEEAVVMDVKDLSFDIIICSTGLVQRIYTNVSIPQSTISLWV